MKSILNKADFDLADWLIILSAGVIMSPFLIGGKALFWGTTILQFIPWRHLAVEIIRSGEIPFWNPYSGMGAPLLANYQSALLYPGNWILILLEFVGGIVWSVRGQAYLIFVHFILAGMGMKRWVKEMGIGGNGQLISGIGFGLCGYLVSRASFQSIIITATWLPWILYFVTRQVWGVRSNTRRNYVWLCLVLTLQFLGGHAQTCWYSLWLTTLWVIFLGWQKSRSEQSSVWLSIRKEVLSWGTAVGAALLLASPQLLPTAEYLLNSQRSGGVDAQIGSVYSFWPWRLLTVLVPNLFGNPASGDYWGYGNYWEDAVYSGSMAFPMALYGLIYMIIPTQVNEDRDSPRVRLRRIVLFWWALIIFSLILAMGKYFPLYSLLLKIPGYEMFQAPTRITLVAQVGIALLAGIGLDLWSKPCGKRLYWLRLASAGSVSVILAAGLFKIAFQEVYPTISTSVLIFGIQMFIFSLLLLKKPENEDKFANVRWSYLAGMFLMVDMIWAGWGLNPATDMDVYRRNIDQPFISSSSERVYLGAQDEYRIKFTDYFRFDTFHATHNWQGVRHALLPNTNLLNNIAMINNFDPLVPARYAEWMNILAEAESKEEKSIAERYLNLSSVKWVVINDSRQQVSFQPSNGMERFRVVYCALGVDDYETAIKMLNTPSFHYQNTVLLEKPMKYEENDCDGDEGIGSASVKVVFESANKQVFKVDTQRAGWFITADTVYPGWKVYVDGEGEKIEVANGLFRAVRIEEGIHTIEFKYRPLWFFVGIALSVVCIVGLKTSLSRTE